MVVGAVVVGVVRVVGVVVVVVVVVVVGVGVAVAVAVAAAAAVVVVVVVAVSSSNYRAISLNLFDPDMVQERLRALLTSLHIAASVTPVPKHSLEIASHSRISSRGYGDMFEYQKFTSV